MTTAALRFEALAAGYGDALLVHCGGGRTPWRLLVDTGPDEAWPVLRERLAQLDADAKGRRFIDLAVISHVDHDHIGAAKALFEDRALGLAFGDVWFNAPQLSARSLLEGQALAGLLRAQPGGAAEALPWNRAWAGRLAVTAPPRLCIEAPASPGQPRLTLLSPTPEKLDRLFAAWARALRGLERAPRSRAKAAVSRGLDLPDPVALAARKTALDAAAPNGSSIALLLEHQGRSVLLAADAHAPVLVAALEQLAAQRGLALPLQVDVFKLSHHASRANITSGLFKAVQARHYVVSTSGAVFDHPDDEAIARVILHGGGAGRTLWFNYRNETSLRWQAMPASVLRGLTVKVPKEGGGGVVIELPAAG